MNNNYGNAEYELSYPRGLYFNSDEDRQRFGDGGMMEEWGRTSGAATNN
jgi:hypothetical protein